MYSSQSEQLPKVYGSKFMVVCYSVVWYGMFGHGMVWVVSIDGCSLQMGATKLGNCSLWDEYTLLVT